jgi:hypothetical protein
MVLGRAGEALAGKYCIDPVESGVSSGSTQEEALLAATKGWTMRATARGTSYASWDNASERAMECGKEGFTFRCRAWARPCLPEGMRPQSP